MALLDIRELERRLIERKRALGIAGRLKPNTGVRRTAAKRQLLEAIDAVVADRGAMHRAPDEADCNDARPLGASSHHGMCDCCQTSLAVR